MAHVIEAKWGKDRDKAHIPSSLGSAPAPAPALAPANVLVKELVRNPHTTAQKRIRRAARCHQRRIWLPPLIAVVLISPESLVAAAEMNVKTPVHSTVARVAMVKQVATRQACKLGSSIHTTVTSPPLFWWCSKTTQRLAGSPITLVTQAATLKTTGHHGSQRHQ